MNCGVFIDTCPILNTTIPVAEEFTNNETSSSILAIASGIGGAFVLGGAIAGTLFMTQRKRAALLFDTTQWNNTSIANPLYQDRTLRFENPMYQDPSEVAQEEED